MVKKLMSLALIFVMAVSCMMVVGCGDKKLQINESALEMEQYEERTLQVNKEGTVVWSSSDPTTVRVADGVVISLKMGTATISATLGEETATCEITVVRPTKNRSLIVSEEEVELFLGLTEGEARATVTAELKQAGTVLSDAQIIWASADDSVAVVDKGVITAVGVGSTSVTVSTRYKGQSLAKKVVVSVRDWTHRQTEMKFMDAATSQATLTAYTGDKTAIGFEATDEVTALATTASADNLWHNRVMADGALTETGDYAYDRMIFDLSLSEPLTGDMLIWMYDKVYTFAAGNVSALTLDRGVVVFDKETGKVFKGKLLAHHVYTFVVTLNQEKKDNKSWGISFGQDTTVYFANVMCCSDDYYADHYTAFEQLPEPYTRGISFVYGDALKPLDTKNADGWYAQTFGAGELWGKRVFLGNVEWPVIHNYTDMKERFDYYGFEFKYTGSCAGAVWTGGYAIIIAADGSLSKEGGGAIAAGDIRFTDPSGKDATNKTLSPDTVYSVKVKIQKEADGVYQNLSTGIGLNEGELFVRNPYFLCGGYDDPQEPVDPPVDDDRLEMDNIVCGDAQTAVSEWNAQVFDGTNLWGGRVYGFTDGVTFANWREYDYYGFDVVFVDEIATATLWRGDETVYAIADGKFNASTGDLFVYDVKGKDVTAEPLVTGVAYTLKIKVYGTDGNSFGLGLGGAGTLLFDHPYLQKDGAEKTMQTSVVCGDSQKPVEKWNVQSFDATNLWGGRVYGFKEGVTFANWREYDYYGFDVVFVDEIATATLWRGDETAYAIADGKFNAQAGDVFVYDAEGKDVTAEPLVTGVAYTLKIKVYGTDGNALGLGLGGAGTLLVRNGYLLKA